MSEKKRGLGRGLGALLGESRRGEELAQVPVGSIRPNPFQPRKHFDEEALSELRASIAEFGVLVPIIVRQRGTGYELIAGERRWRAAAALQLSTIPAVVRTSDDRDSLEVAIIENLQRENLNPLEEATGYASLMEDYEFTQERLAERLGRSRPTIANALRLLTLSDAIKAMLADGRLSAGHARAVLAAPEDRRLPLARRAVDEGLSVREVERLANVPVSAPRAPAVTSRLSADEQAFETKLRFRLGTHVALKRGGRGGRIEIRFNNEKDLIRIAEVLLGDESRG
ncbi:MAG: ParB/RepB/Spo0J family partition protein [Candidatus Eremiobacteraeota bacterium]|nr:ParB/RepB/Spo0J family partition protein [Candidatus Eremiobacteraeota bacterium]